MPDTQPPARKQAPNGFSRIRAGQAWWAAEGRFERAVALRDAGWSYARIGRELGTTKNTVLGLFSRRFGPDSPVRSTSTIFERLDALHAKMDRILAETQPAIDARTAVPAPSGRKFKLAGSSL